MATVGSLLQIQENIQKCEFLVKHLLIPTYDVLESNMVCVLVGPNSPWYQETYAYLHDNTIPPYLTETQQQTFIGRSTHYTILGDTLFPRQYYGTLLMCLDKEEVEQTLCEVHESIYEAHSSGLTLAKNLLHT